MHGWKCSVLLRNSIFSAYWEVTFSNHVNLVSFTVGGAMFNYSLHVIIPLDDVYYYCLYSHSGTILYKSAQTVHKSVNQQTSTTPYIYFSEKRNLKDYHVYWQLSENSMVYRCVCQRTIWILLTINFRTL